ncbi:F-box protein DOR [Raphanus sativus]|uniref:F-box protein At2g19630 n=1 Tax=Raphanus sativus TaxID=3726 RepID=A0A9W3DJB6_RAPSA|nr:putative F-box protein At2g19630 [Raphanus sativus]KAJ4903435.1 F-box protein DOR [Raphanus sativus]
MKPQRQNVSKGGLTISRRVTRSMTTFDRNSLTLPVEVVTEIFLRLPLKSIARCRCVCKLWSSILRSQDFTESFLTRSTACPRLMFAFQVHSEVVLFSSPQLSNPEENSYVYVVATKHLALSPYFSRNYVCSTNGFFCDKTYVILKEEKYPGFAPVIRNPNTGQSLTLPILISKKRYGVQSYIGYDLSYLGYEPIAKEFKVLSMIKSRVSDEWISVDHQVLTLGTKNLSWRLVECCIPHYFSDKWICISGVLYYAAKVNGMSRYSMVACFDLKSEKFSFVKLMETFNRVMEVSTTMVNYNGKLGLLLSRDDSVDVTRASTSFELWVLRDAAKHVWSKHVYMLPALWKDVVEERMVIAGMVGTNVIVLSPWWPKGPAYVIYYNVERKTITKVGIQGMEAYQRKSFHICLNYVENVEIL